MCVLTVPVARQPTTRRHQCDKKPQVATGVQPTQLSPTYSCGALQSHELGTQLLSDDTKVSCLVHSFTVPMHTDNNFCCFYLCILCFLIHSKKIFFILLLLHVLSLFHQLPLYLKNQLCLMNFLSETPEEATTWPSTPFCLSLIGLKLCTCFKDMQTGWLAANQICYLI